MEPDALEYYVGQSNNSINESQSAVNSLIIDYYKKFGKKRDLEQFFSLSTAQSDVRDPSSLFWRKMKSQTDSSDSGEKKSESSAELCRISIQCSIPQPSSSQEQYYTIKSDSESPPIIREEDAPNKTSDNESVKSDGVYSHKSVDGTLDTSANKPQSPTSSVTSQRKFEWDSLADVGYANESDRKNSASSLSTLERLALQHQYSNNDTKHSELGQPTAQSTPFEINHNLKNRKSAPKKTTKIFQRDADSVKLNISQNPENPPQPINVNLTKHISFNVEKDGGVTIENITKNVSVSPEKVSVETEVTPLIKSDKEIQTTLTKNQKTSTSSEVKEQYARKFPVIISLNTLKKRTRNRKVRKTRRQQSLKKQEISKKDTPLQKSTEQLSEAESFEYMPGHIYNQKQLISVQNRNNDASGNKSSLESSAGLTTDSSKTTKYSFAKDLETGIDILNAALDHKYEDSRLKKKLIKEVIQRLIKTKYKDDESSTEFLSGLSFDSKKLDLYNHTTSSTSDGNYTANKAKQSKPKKSILRMDKFNANAMASTSQSVPNLNVFTENQQTADNKTTKTFDSNTESDLSNKNKNLSDTGIDKISSEVLYKKYLEALKREQAYKKHLKNKEIFLKQKLVSSDHNFNIAGLADDKSHNNIKDLMKDLVRNNYDDGSGDASKLEGTSTTNINIEKHNSLRKHRSHSVFTLSSGNSDNYKKQKSMSNTAQTKVDCSESCYKKSEMHYCHCPYHTSHPLVADTCVQVDIKNKDSITPAQNTYQSAVPKNYIQNEQQCKKCKAQQLTKRDKKVFTMSDCEMEHVKYVCLCTGEGISEEVPENILIYKCSRLSNNNVKQSDKIEPKPYIASDHFPSSSTSPGKKASTFNSEDCERKCLVIKDNQTSKTSQTNFNLPIKLQSQSSEQSLRSSSSEEKKTSCFSQRKKENNAIGQEHPAQRTRKLVHEATRWIQTDLSINPKISNPSLTDIKVVTDNNGVKLISEHYKEISQSPSEDNAYNQDENINTVLRSGDSRSSSSGSYKVDEKDSKSSLIIKKDLKETSTNTDEKIHEEISSSPTVANNNILTPVAIKSNNFTIPIHGTNMTLKVSLGSDMSDIANKNKEIPNKITYESKGTNSIENNLIENYTSLQEECTKAVQSDKTNDVNMLTQPSESTCSIKENTIKVNNKTNGNKAAKSSEPCFINSCLTDGCKYNTFPKKDRTNAQKPLIRSNTDTGRIEKTCHVSFNQKPKIDNDVQPVISPALQKRKKYLVADIINDKASSCCSEISVKNNDRSSDTDIPLKVKSSTSESDYESKGSSSKDPILDIIQDITRRYSKKDVEKSKRNKCFKDIITFLNYLLDTDDNSDSEKSKKAAPLTCDNNGNKKIMYKENNQSASKKTFVDKGVQLSNKKSKPRTDSSDLPISSDVPSTSSDSATCKILEKIKRECEKYHQKQCKCNKNHKKCEASSSSSASCDQCQRVHRCSCKGYKCKTHKTKTSPNKKKKCVAYNLIIQTSDSVVSEEIPSDNRHKLKNIIVKVPSQRNVEKVPFQEVASKIKKDLPNYNPQSTSRNYRSRSLPNECEISSTDDILKKAQVFTVREYLEKNRPDFVQKCSKRQHCLKEINETRPREYDNTHLNMIVVHKPVCSSNPCVETCNMCYKDVPINDCNICFDPYIHCIHNELTRIANERSVKRQLLSLQLDRQQALSALSHTELKKFAKQLGDELRRKKVAPKFISEKEMKKHSEKIYKSLPEVVRKKEDMKKDNIKKTNLLMANIFKKNLQKKTLQGAVNLSNYSTVIKI